MDAIPLTSIAIGTAGLTAALIASIGLTLTRAPVADARVPALRIVAGVNVALQAAHALEETATHFYARFPEFLGLAPWPQRFFVAFNGAWLVVWIAAIAALPALRRLAAVPLWFLGIASIGNAIVHPALAAATGDYFPGLWTSPFVGLAGLALIRALTRATQR